MTGGVRIGFDICVHIYVYYISLFSTNKQSKKNRPKEGKRGARMRQRERESLANRHDESNNASAIRTVRNPQQQG